MADQEGYIKIDRNILKWGWYNNIKTCHLFFHLLIRANYKEGIFMGTKIERGQLATSHGNLGNETGLTVDEIRTALRHLESTGEITVTRKPRYIVITVVKYSEYQNVPSQIPSNSQANPSQSPAKSQSNPNKRNTLKHKAGKKEYTGDEFPKPGETATINPEIDLVGFPSAEDMPSEAAGEKRDIPPRVRHLFSDYGAYWRWMHRET